MSKQATKEEFIEKAKEVHGDFYSYSAVEYVNNATKVKIICPIHGEFYQQPRDHTGKRPQGCKKCGLEKTADKNRVSKNEFIKRSCKLHGNRYDYSLVDYKQLKDKVTIICHEHGEFLQKAESHMIGHGCNKCAVRGFNKEIPGWLYFVYLPEYDLYKIGVTNLGVGTRLTKENYEVIYTKYYNLGYDAFLQEQLFIRNNLDKRYTGTDIMYNNGSTELFNLGCPKDAEGKLMKPDNFPNPEPRLQALLDKILYPDRR